MDTKDQLSASATDSSERALSKGIHIGPTRLGAVIGTLGVYLSFAITMAIIKEFTPGSAAPPSILVTGPIAVVVAYLLGQLLVRRGDQGYSTGFMISQLVNLIAFILFG